MHMVRTISITVLIFDLYSRSYETYYLNNNLITDFVHCTKRHAKQKQNKKLKQKLKNVEGRQTNDCSTETSCV